MTVQREDTRPVSTSDGPRALCDLQALAADPGSTAILWRLTETGRQLDANLMHLAGDDRVGLHGEPDLDVLLVVVAGTACITTADDLLPLTPGTAVWLPRGCTRSIAAGDGGVSYLTVHQRRPGMRIGSRPDHLPAPPPPRETSANDDKY